MAAGSGDDVFVEFERVQKSYDGVILVVKDLNLAIGKGEFVTMLGPSGSGKTTCLMMLAGFETAVAPMPALEGEADLAFGVRVHPQMDRGRAQVLVQITFDCGIHRQVETAPWLQFRVLDD